MTTNLQKTNVYSMIIAAVACLAYFCGSSTVTVRAQWTTPDASQNINNTNSGNVGVGTSSPGVKLDVMSSINLIARFGTSGAAHSQVLIDAPSGFNSNLTLQRGGVSKWYMGNRASNDRLSFIESTGNIEVLTVLQNGKVGIGTIAPTGYLHITTAAADYEALRLHRNGNPNGWGVAQLFALNNSSGAVTDYAQISGGITSNTAGAESGVLAFYTRNSGTLAERMRVAADGRVGIGTQSPQDAFHLFNTTNTVGTMRLQGGNTNAAFIGMWDPGQMFILANNRHPGTGNNFNTATVGAEIAIGAPAGAGDIAFFTTSNGTVGNATELVRMRANGTVGIGTVSPNYKLDVQGGSINTSQGICFNGDCKTAWAQVSTQWANGGSNAISYSAGSVGIGIAAPAYSLDVNGGVNGFRAKAGTTSANDAIATFENGSAIQMIVRGNGNVGIATTAPTEKLHVTGNIKVTGNIDVGGNINAKYQDVAEWVESSQPLTAGTVVIIDPTKPNQVIASTQAYDSRVGGVISLQPGIALGEHGEGRVLVASTGRVKVKVDASSGPIQMGDLLVTSDRPGYAMKSTPVDVSGIKMHRPGTLIGKALEPLAQGSGEILVLLSIQ